MNLSRLLRKLFHFTCDDAAPLILHDGWIKPGPLWGVVWLTDLPHPDRLALGLTSHTLDCDRMAWRFTVKTHAALPWAFARNALLDHPLLDNIEQSEGADPSHWFVSINPIRVRKAQRYAAPQPFNPDAPPSVP